MRSSKARLVLVLLASGVPAHAWAQTGSSGGTGTGATVTIPNPDTQPVLLESDNRTIVTRDPTLNIRNGLYSYEDCIKDRRIRYQLTNSNTDPTLPLEVWVSQNQDCSKAENRGSPFFQCWKAQPDAVPNAVQTESILRLQDIVSQYSTLNTERTVPYEPGTIDDCRNLNNLGFGIDFQYVRGTGIEGAPAKANVTFDTVGPAPPSGVATGVGEQLVEVRWNLPSQNTDVTRYVVYCDDGKLQQLPVGSSSSSSSSSGTTTPEDDAGNTDDAGASNDAGTTGDSGAQGVRPLQDTTSSSGDTSGTSSGTSGTSGAVTAEPGTSTACPPNIALREGELPLPSWRPCATVTGGTGNKVQITSLGTDAQGNEIPLLNDQAYGFAVSSYDNLGNPGPLSGVICNTPVQTLDFFDGYRAAGGQAGGCSTTGATLSSAAPTCAFGFLAMALARGAYRRRVARRDSSR